MDWKKLPEIADRRLSLRWMTTADVDALYDIFSHPQVMRYWSTPPLETREQAHTLLEEIQAGFRHQLLLKWGIALRSSNQVIGTATLFNLDWSNRRAEIGYALRRSHWGNGYMQEALTALLNHAFNVWSFRRIEADVDPRNEPSIKTLERLGFQREGFLRERWEVAGEIQDAFYYGLLRREWEQIDRNKLENPGES
jgi:RimJ/RimL family protein N-acetyltransferase